MLKAGFGKISITPAVGSPLAGFAARVGVCEGIHDELYSRALVLENEANTVIIISVDVLAVDEDLVKRVRNRIQSRSGIDARSILIASTHTHAGPVTIKTFFNPYETLDRKYMDRLANAIEESAILAWESRFPARVGVGSGQVSGIGVNRRTPDKKPIDEEIGIIKVENSDGRVRGVLMNYSCHPTVLGSDNLLATGDFPYFAVDRVEKEIGGDGFAMFVNGTQGNISMGHSSELSAIGVITPGRTFEHAEELGNKLADGTLTALVDIPTNDSPEIGVAVSQAYFPLKDLPDLATASQNLIAAEKELDSISGDGAPIERVMGAKSKRLYASITDFYARETSVFEDGHLPVELQAVRIDNAVLLAVPAEVFVEIGLSIKKHAQHPVFIIGIANGYIGYLPTETAYAADGYEVVSSKVSPATEAVLYDEAKNLEDRLFAREFEQA